MASIDSLRPREKPNTRKHRGSYLAGTCKWLSSSAVFRQWHDGDSETLRRIKAIAGSSKFVIAAWVINELCKEGFPDLYCISFFDRLSMQIASPWL
jgi:hypothetical protein